LEVVNALHLRVLRKELSGYRVQSSLSDFEKDMRHGIFLLRPLPEQVFEWGGQSSRQTTAQRETHTADLLHVGAALELAAKYVYTLDEQQRTLARTVELKIKWLVVRDRVRSRVGVTGDTRPVLFVREPTRSVRQKLLTIADPTQELLNSLYCQGWKCRFVQALI
jgi:hypothetical protein